MPFSFPLLSSVVFPNLPTTSSWHRREQPLVGKGNTIFGSASTSKQTSTFSPKMLKQVSWSLKGPLNWYKYISDCAGGQDGSNDNQCILGSFPVGQYCTRSIYRKNWSLIWTVFVKEIRRVIEWLREIKTADQHCYKFLLIQLNKFFWLNVN